MIMNLWKAFYALVVVTTTAFISKYFVDFGLVPFYDLLEVPDITPDKSYFRYIWGVLYVLLFISFYIALTSKTSVDLYLDMDGLFITQFFLQILWSYCFFYIQQIGFAVSIILLLCIIVAMLLHTLYLINKVAFVLIIPYMAWLLFASYLNIFVFFNN